jgi:ribonuclease J
MQKISRPIENNEIKGIVEKTTDFFIWKNKKKRPLVRTAIFDI